MIKKVKKLYQINLNKVEEEEENQEEEELTEDERMVEFLAGICSATVSTCCEYADEYFYDRNDIFESIILSLRKFYHAVDLNDLELEDDESWIFEDDKPYGDLS